ncbi:Myb-like_DNA-binding domain-containing protein [Hexamita inflata]|uniref:Myb-like DNA-binding domain-containing protein n=1 Tax=Hexamita inflata TaxID=28002 RepID=A0AA86V3F3_9EUKA|nr:Myb-like DNA-binding domain-containing protein [Hexamita inflata]
MPIVHWTENEKQFLLESVNKNKINNRIQWKAVQSEIKTKSYNQCRTMYSVMLKPAEVGQVNFNWSFKNYAMLMVCVLEYGTKWTFIQKNYFPDITPNAIKKKFMKSKSILQKLIDVLKMLNRLKQIELNDQEVFLLKLVIQFLCYRSDVCNWYNELLVDPNIPKPPFPALLEKYRDDEMEAEPIDIIESKLYKRISRKMDFEQMRIQIMQIPLSHNFNIDFLKQSK